MSLEKYMIPCLNKTIFGIECLGCGFQRSLLLLLQCKFTEAFKMYPAVYTILLFFVCCIVATFDKKRVYGKLIFYLGILNAILMVTSYYYKNYDNLIFFSFN